MLRDAQQLTQLVRVEDADPPDPYALGASGEPKVLHGCASTVHICVGDWVTTQYRRTESLPIACNADVQRGIQNPFQLEREVCFSSPVAKSLRGAQSFRFNMRPHTLTNL